MSGFLLSNRATRALARLLRGKMGDSSTATAAPSPISRNRTAEPFALKYAASANSAAGAWIIWLSADSLIYAGSTIDLTAGLTAAGTPYPAGWYQVGVLAASGGTLYLIIDASGSTPTASFAAAASSQAGRTSILIATATRNTTTGAVSVRQNIVGALAYGGGGGGGSGIDATVESYKDLAYSTSTHEFTAKKVTMTFVQGLLTSHTVDQNATVIFTATPHSAEHS